MKGTFLRNQIGLLICLSLLLPAVALGGSNGSKGGPPSHAPAHGYRAKHKYHYYEGANVYYDTERKLYFYMQGDKWGASVSLPLDIKARLGSYVSLELDLDKPYLRN